MRGSVVALVRRELLVRTLGLEPVGVVVQVLLLLLDRLGRRVRRGLAHLACAVVCDPVVEGAADLRAAELAHAQRWMC